MIKQLNQLTTMLDAYEDCEVTEPLLLERIDGDMMATVLEWCTSFLDPDVLVPVLDSFRQPYFGFGCTHAENAFLEQRKYFLRKIADAADNLDARRLKFCALKFLNHAISQALWSRNAIPEARKLMGFPASMKGLYRKSASGTTRMLDGELSNELCCELFRFESYYDSLQ
ncbi:hypothetical protein AAVH_36286 [Aphelenchoides avenae]|nr:hypothetical protein AAVH_36286 [Aphelenchus avenae]